MSAHPRVVTAIVAFLVIAAAPLAAQHEHHGAAGEQVGRVEFPVSCKPDARQPFERAIAMLHSFWFSQALQTFEQAAAADPDCAMAHWGIAMTLLGNPMARVSPPEARLKDALAAAEKAAALGRSASARERAYIDAVLALYRDHETKDHTARMRAHEEGMRAVHERFPDDAEAAIFYGRVVVANAPPDDMSFAQQLHAATILEPLFQKHPDHPGLAHYLIHAFDAPAIADKGLEAAKRYAGIAPSAPHALHMPSHIFTRLGHWDESIDTNRRSAAAEPDSNAAVHPMDYMVYAYLQQGRDDDAGRVVARAVRLPDRFYGGLIGYNFTAMPARLALERGRWEDAVGLKIPTGALPYVEAITRFARAVGAARSGQPATAREEVAVLARLEQTLKQQNDQYWATIVGAQRMAAAAWVARADGQDAEAVRLATAAADLEESVEKHPITPGPLLPARELLADLLLDLGRNSDALDAYEATLKREHNRARALFGAARAAELAGRREHARQRYTELLALMDEASPREELRFAREFLKGP